MYYCFSSFFHHFLLFFIIFHHFLLFFTAAASVWIDASPPHMEDFEFRDVVATDAETALILSIGFGDASRIMRTTNGGDDWATLFVATPGNGGNRTCS